MSTGFRPLSTRALRALELRDLNPVDTSWSAFNYYIHIVECTPNLALWEGMCCGCGHRSCPAHNGADIKHATYVCVHASDTTHLRTMVEALQLSGQVTSFQVPSEIMGSIVKVCPRVSSPQWSCSLQAAVVQVEGCHCEVHMY